MGVDPFSAAASVVDAGINYWSNDETNRSNREIADNTNRANSDLNGANNWFSSNQAEVQRQFQSWMSSTAYQRSMKDMQLAGLNPILAYSQGGASTPSGSNASPSGIPNQMGTPNQPFKTDVASSALQLAKLRADTDNSKLTNQKIASDTVLNKQLTDNAKRSGILISNNANIARSNSVIADKNASLANIENIPAKAILKSGVVQDVSNVLGQSLSSGYNSAKSFLGSNDPNTLMGRFNATMKSAHKTGGASYVN